MNLVSLSGALCPHKPSGLLGTGAQDGHLDFHTATELCNGLNESPGFISDTPGDGGVEGAGVSQGCDNAAQYR